MGIHSEYAALLSNPDLLVWILAACVGVIAVLAVMHWRASRRLRSR